MKPRTRAVPPARSASASSMQSPRGQRGGHQRHHLVTGVGSAFCMAQVQDAGQPVGAGQGAGPGWTEESARHWPPGGDHRRRCGCGRVGERGSIYWVLLFRDWFAVTPYALSQIQRSTLWPLQDADPTPYGFGGFGVKVKPGANSLSHTQTTGLPTASGDDGTYTHHGQP